MDVLQLDVSGRPQAWITPREAALLYACDAVAWTLGRACHVLRGGIQRTTGLQSRIEVHSIIAVKGAVPSRAWRHTPLRLGVYIQAPQEPMDRIIANHETVRHLLDHEWLHLFRLDDAAGCWRYSPGGGWQAVAA